VGPIFVKFKLSKDAARIPIQVSLMMAAFVAANHFHIAGLVLVWIALAAYLAFRWELQDQAAANARDLVSERVSADGRRATAHQLIVSTALGLAWAILLGTTFADVVHGENIDFSLIGVPDLIPVGSFALGAIGAGGYTFALGWFGRRPVAGVLYLIVGLAVLALISIYAARYAVSDNASAKDYFMASVAQAERLERSQPIGAFIGPAPVPVLTPLVQLFGFMLGGLVAFLRANPLSRPWSAQTR
jgi:diacylglycerol kinase